MTRARDLADSADKDIAGTLTLDGLTVDGGTAYHKLISTFPATYTTNLQVGQQVNISNNAVTDTLSIENTGTAAATNIQFSTAGSERMRIDSSGNVGIGTSSPSETLDVSGNIRALGANSRVMFGPDGFEAGIKYATDASLQIAARSGETITFTNGNDGAEHMRITSDGIISINDTTDPTAGGFAPKLHVKQGTNGAFGGFTVEGHDTDVVGGFGYNSTAQTFQIAASYRSTSGYKPLAFHTSGQERMRIDSAGRVTMPYQPAFSVTHSSNAYLSGTIVFNTAQVNVGGHYSTSTGRFTAPVAGNYYFIFATIVGNSGGFEVILQKNGSGVTGVGYCSTGSNDTGVVAKVISLSAGDYVTAYTSTGNIESQYSSFAGYLIG